MFIFTAKFDKKKAIIAVLLLGVLLCTIILAAGNRDSNPVQTSSLSAVVKNNGQRVDYLSSFGWEIETEPLETQEILIPAKFDSVYEEYNKLQQTQGFNLKNYCGMEATRYTYKVLNYPDSSKQNTVVADIIVYRNQVIAGDIQSVSLGGFMHGLEFPNETD